MRLFIPFLLALHGLIHLLGFVKAFDLAPVEQLTMPVSRLSGLFWLLAALLLIVTALLYLLNYSRWWTVGAAGVMLSQTLIVLAWGDAKFGTVGNLILLVPIAAAFLNTLPSSFDNRFRTVAEEGLARGRETQPELLTEADLSHLPQPVREYIRYSGAVGREKVRNFRAVLGGRFKPNPNSDFLDIRAVQYNFYDEPSRAFLMKAKMYGLPVEGLHLYTGEHATMQIKAASLLQVADARGPVMDQSETVTLFNDMCFLAPATLIDERIEWELVNPNTVGAIFTNRGHTISATLYFNDRGELVNFSSDDRAESADGKEFNRYRWTTPLSDYREFGGRKVAGYGEAIWHKPEGEHCYAKFSVREIAYNLNDFKS